MTTPKGRYFMKKKNDVIAALTKRDLDILNTLWNSEKSLTASEICQLNDDITMNTIQAVLRKLLKNNLIEVADIVYSGTVLCRSYRPVISSGDYALAKLTTDYQNFGKEVSKSSLVAALLDSENNPEQRKSDIEHLEMLLEKYKQNL